MRAATEMNSEPTMPLPELGDCLFLIHPSDHDTDFPLGYGAVIAVEGTRVTLEDPAGTRMTFERDELTEDNGTLIHSYNDEWCDDCQGPCQYADEMSDEPLEE